MAFKKDWFVLCLMTLLVLMVACDDSGEDSCADDDDDTSDGDWVPTDGDLSDGDTSTTDDDDDNTGLTCEDGPCLQVPESISFGAVFYGMSNTRELRIAGSGFGAVTIRDIFLTDLTSEDFEVLSPTLPLSEPIVVAQGQEYVIEIKYTRSGIEGDEGRLIITSTDVRQANHIVELQNEYKGTVDLNVIPNSHDFGPQAQGVESNPVTLSLQATGSSDSNRILTVESMRMDTGSVSPFILHPEPVEGDALSDCQTPFLLPSGNSRNCRVAFLPTGEGEFADNLQIIVSDRGEEDQIIEVPLSGTSQQCTPGDNSTCDDNNPCTIDVCGEDGGCSHEDSDVETCDDGNFCSTNDHCEGGVCVGTLGTKDCSDVADDSGCQIGVCNNDAGECQVEFMDDGITTCDDTPTSPKVCSQGTCIPVQLKLSEVMYDVSNVDDEREWVEIYNGTGVPLKLSNYKIAGGADSGTGGYLFTYNGFLSGTMPAGACWVVGGPISNSDNANPDFDIPLNFNDDIQNINSATSAGNGLGLFYIEREGNITDSSVPIDAVIYGNNNNDDLLCPNGSSCPGAHVEDCGASNTIERNGNNWSVNINPSPGVCHVQ